MADNDTEVSSPVVKQQNINEISKTSSIGCEEIKPPSDFEAGFAMQRNGSMNANNDRCKVFISTQQYRFCGDGYNDALESERFDGFR